MNFGTDFFGDWWDSKKEELFEYVNKDTDAEEFDPTKNNLSSIKEFLEFFKALLYFFNDCNYEMIEKCFAKLDYLGFSLDGHLEMISNDANDILNSMVQAAYLLHEENNEMNKLIYKYFYDNVIALAKGE